MRTTRLCSAFAAIIMAGCVALAFGAKRADLPLLVYDGTPHIVSGPPLLQAISASGGDIRPLEAGGVGIYADLSFGHRVEVLHSGPVPIHLVARGTAVSGVYPYITLHVDGEFHSGFYVASDSWGLYRLPLQLSRGKHDLEWSYVNDGSAYPENRNVDLLSLTFGDPPYQILQYQRWSAPCLVDPARMALRTYGDPSPDEYRLWNHGMLADDVYFDSPGRYPVRVFVYGSNTGKRKNRLQLQLNGEVADEFELDPSSGALTGWVDVDAGVHRLGLLHRSPLDESPLGQDLLISRITVGEALRAKSGRRGPVRLPGKDTWIPGHAIESRSGGTASGNAWTLWSNGYLAQRVSTNIGGQWWMAVRARADLCEGQGPHLLVMRGADQLGVLEINEARSHDYRFLIELPPGIHRVALVYDNDLRIDGRCDRNLHLDSLAFLVASNATSKNDY